MKKITLILFVLFASTLKSQIWIDLGIKGGYLPTLALNNNLINDKTNKLGMGTSYLYGAKIGVNFNQEYSVCSEVLFTTLSPINKNSLSLNYIQIPILFRYNQDNGSYSEIGPQISLFRGAKSDGTDVQDQFTSTNYDIVAGLGQYIGGGNGFGFNLGVRVACNLNDIIGSEFRTEEGNAVFTPVETDATPLSDFKYNATRNLYVGIVLEFNFNLGYFQKGPNCHNKTRFKLF